MRTLLIKPPFSDPSLPPLSIPTLAAYCRKQGQQIDIYDIDIGAFYHLTTPGYLASCQPIIEERLKAKADLCTNAQLTALKKAKAILPYISKQIVDSVTVLRSKERFYDYVTYRSALNIVNAVFEIIAAARYPISIAIGDYHINETHSISNLRNHIHDETTNVFIPYYINTAIPRIADLAPDLIGISITYLSQFLPALTLVNQLHMRLPNVPIVIGGAYLTALAPRLSLITSLLKGVVAAVLFEGESALSQIIQRLEMGLDLTGIPNVAPMHQLSTGIIPKRPEFIEAFAELPAPDFDGLPLDMYLIPEIVLPIQSSRGCYWGRCAFCGTSLSTSGKFRMKPTDKFLSELDFLHSKYHCSNFRFSDDATPPVMLDAVATHISEGNRQYYWSTEARFHPSLDESFCRKLRRGGCCHLLFGFESSNNRVLQIMGKGTSIQLARINLESCRKAGIPVNLQVFIGFPGETREEAMETITFLLKERSLYTSVALASFSAVFGSKVAEDPFSFGVTLLSPQDMSHMPIECKHKYATSRGLSPNEATELADLAIRRLSGSDVMGPGLLHGSCGAHGQLYGASLNRREFDAIGVDNFRWKWNIDKHTFGIPTSVQFIPLADNVYLVIDLSRGFYTTVNKFTIDACELLLQHPAKITSVAFNITERHCSERADAIDILADVESSLIHLARLGILVHKKATTARNGQRVHLLR